MKLLCHVIQIFWDSTPCQMVNSYQLLNEHGALIVRVQQSKSHASRQFDPKNKDSMTFQNVSKYSPVSRV